MRVVWAFIGVGLCKFFFSLSAGLSRSELKPSAARGPVPARSNHFSHFPPPTQSRLIGTKPTPAVVIYKIHFLDMFCEGILSHNSALCFEFNYFTFITTSVITYKRVQSFLLLTECV